ncbi:hypothetical protein MC7420_6413 [Coleofasciculus chthonoplastes PCC 7420]|uniref:Uncharacterized protein n=1 Tax=Coleofasciculus chthonoplastes PCC 7420 TaxID=118168 RepID=B4VQV4_9CYAN|nr:hypothetical protein MC7420_6413 [Coleofasciculus chthonoplastes PCC 7420]
MESVGVHGVESNRQEARQRCIPTEPVLEPATDFSLSVYFIAVPRQGEDILYCSVPRSLFPNLNR